jgi:hypothetical protein
MYCINKHADHLRVEFQDDFNYNLIKTIIRHETMMLEYPYTNDIWLVGTHRADIRLGELQTMVNDFHCHCPSDSTRTKTAIVADPGLTQAILELWVNGVKNTVKFELRIFDHLEEAEEWLGIAQSKVA